MFVTLVNYEKAFDIDRVVLWKLLHHYGIPEIYIVLMQKSYEKSTCRVIHNGVLSEMFEMLTGVRQGCLSSPFLFLLSIDWIMRQTTEANRDGIQRTLTTRLEDLDFADDIALLSHNHQGMQAKVTRLAKISAMYGSETWTASKETSRKLQSFVNRCLRSIMGIHWPEVIRKEDLWERAEQERIDTQITRRKWGWIGHTFRHALRWNPQGKRSRGRPRKSWKRTVDDEVGKAGLIWRELETPAQNSLRWRAVSMDPLGVVGNKSSKSPHFQRRDVLIKKTVFFCQHKCKII